MVLFNCSKSLQNKWPTVEKVLKKISSFNIYKKLNITVRCTMWKAMQRVEEGWVSSRGLNTCHMYIFSTWQRCSELQSLKSLNSHHLTPASDSRRRGYSQITREGQSSQEKSEGSKHSKCWFYCEASISGMSFCDTKLSKLTHKLL